MNRKGAYRFGHPRSTKIPPPPPFVKGGLGGGNSPLPSRERVGVRGIKMERLEISGDYHPHPTPPPLKGEEKKDGLQMYIN